MMNKDDKIAKKVKHFSIDSLLYDKNLIGDGSRSEKTSTGYPDEGNGHGLDDESDVERKSFPVSNCNSRVNGPQRTSFVSAIFPTASFNDLPRLQPPKHIFSPYSPTPAIFGGGCGAPLMTPPMGLAFHLASATPAALYGRLQPQPFAGAVPHYQNCRTPTAASVQQHQTWRPQLVSGARMVNGLPLLGGIFAAAAAAAAGHSQTQPSTTQSSTSSGSNAKKYKCDVCHKAFSRSNTLVTHKRIHTGEKPFLCDHCGRAFRQPGNLTRHRLTHTTVKPYTCQQCGKAFNRASNLHTHARTHNLYKPFICNICDKGFYQKVDLRLHVRTHIDKLDRSMM